MQASGITHRPVPAAAAGDAGPSSSHPAPGPGRRSAAAPSGLQELRRAPSAPADEAPATSRLQTVVGAVSQAAQHVVDIMAENPLMTFGVGTLVAGRVIGSRAARDGDIAGQMQGAMMTTIGAVATAASLGGRIVMAAIQPPEFARPWKPDDRPGPLDLQRAATAGLAQDAAAGDGARPVSQLISRSPFFGQGAVAMGVQPQAWAVPSASPGIGINRDSSPAFRDKVDQSLQRLQEIPSGQAVLKQIESITAMYPEKQVVIQPTTGPMVTIPAWEEPKHRLQSWNFADTAVASVTGDAFMPYVAGKGVDTAVVMFNAEKGYDYAADPDHGRQDPSHAFLGLGHELAHASHMLHGAHYGTPVSSSTRDRNSAAAEEELRTTGAGPWKDEPVSENAMRRHLGLAERRSYSGNPGRHLRQPPERNSPETAQKLVDMGAKLKQD